MVYSTSTSISPIQMGSRWEKDKAWLQLTMLTVSQELICSVML